MTNKPEPQDVREAYDAFLNREKLHTTTPGRMWKAFQAGHAAALAQSDTELRLEEDAQGKRAMLGGYQMSDKLIPSLEAQSMVIADAQPTQDVREAYPDRDYRHGSDLIAALRKGYPITNLRLSVADEIERALAKSPEQQNVQVTDAMVDRAVTAYFGEHGEIFSLGGAHEAASGDMRRALVAALAQSDAQPVAHGEAIPDCPTEGVAARQGNGG